jgi:hypothetical protein
MHPLLCNEWNKECRHGKNSCPIWFIYSLCSEESAQRSSDMKILVTGATRKVGGAVVGDLLKRGASVRALSRKQPEPGKLPQGLEIALGDLTDPPSILKALDGIDKMLGGSHC